MYKGFTTVELHAPKRSTFDLSHEHRISGRMGKLMPVFCSETLPNDTFYGSTEVLIKLAPMLAPIFHRMNLYVHYFFVPNRLLWEDWEDFITGGRLGPGIDTPPVPPYLDIQQVLTANPNAFDWGTLPNYLRIPRINPGDPPANWAGRTLDVMPFAAYYRAWYDYYRDRNYYVDNDILPLPSGATPYSGVLNQIMQMRYRAWQHDYFTSALPFVQRGAEVLMPLQGSGSVSYMPTSKVRSTGGALVSDESMLGTDNDATGDLRWGKNSDVDPGQTGRIENIAGVDITNSDVSINDLRRAVALQTWLERNALAGSRYNESIMAHFARKTSDSRLQRAEYLGGGKAVIQVSDVMTTAYSEDASAEVVPPGNMAGRGSAYTQSNRFTYNCEEHGFIIGILSVMPTSAYMQGIPRMFTSRNTFLDYPWPTFANLGEQEVYVDEIYFDSSNYMVNGTREDRVLFGYQSRYADWKHIPSGAMGDFQNSLDFWHLVRKFDTQPALNGPFVLFEDELQDRIFAVSGVDTLWMYIYNKINVKRSLPYFGTPKLK